MVHVPVEVRHAARALRRSPGFTAAAVVTLAVGVGANAAMFSVVNGVLLRPLPYPGPDRIVVVAASRPQEPRDSLAPANFLDMQRDNRVFEHVAAYREDVFDFAVAGGDPQRLEGAQVTPAFFDVFGVGPVAGRTFDAARDGPGGDRLAVLGEGAWARAFGRDRGLVGRSVRINGEPVTIVGIMPAGFAWPPEASDIWVLAPKPVPTPPIEVPGDFLQQRGLSYFDAVARLKPAVTVSGARADLDAIAARLAAAFPDNNANRGFAVTTLREQIVGEVRPSLLALLGTVGLLLLIASANVAGLFVARATSRQREVGIRAALGASRWRLVRQFLAESVLLSAAGAAAGLVLAYGSVRILVAFTPAGSVPRLDEVGLDLRVAAFALLCAGVAAILFGLTPAVQASRADLASSLKEGARAATPASHRLGASLVIGQVALTLVVLVGAGLLLNSFVRLQRVEPGFTPERVMAVELPIPQARYATPERQAGFYHDVRERLRSRADLQTAAIFPVPLGGGTDSAAPLRREGKPEPPRGAVPLVLLSMTTPNAFGTLGVRLIRGRDFTEADDEGAPQVAIVSAEAARRFWPGEDPIGTRVTLGGDDPFTIVGVVGDIRRRGLHLAAEPTIYLSYRQLVLPFMTLLVRTTGDPVVVVSDVRAAVRAVDPDLPIGETLTLEQRVAQSVAAPRFRTLLVGAFGTIALLLAAVGVYALISYTVAARVREMAIRLALGATPSQVRRLAMGQGLRLAGMGVAVGLALAMPASRLVSSLLFGVGAVDAPTYAGVIVVLVGVAAAASYVPARRASRVDPLVALRAD